MYLSLMVTFFSDVKYDKPSSWINYRVTVFSVSVMCRSSLFPCNLIAIFYANQTV